VLFAQHSSLRRTPVLVSLGDAFLRPSYKDRFFTEELRETLDVRYPRGHYLARPRDYQAIVECWIELL
jgi:hypothetical protein